MTIPQHLVANTERTCVNCGASLTSYNPASKYCKKRECRLLAKALAQRVYRRVNRPWVRLSKDTHVDIIEFWPYVRGDTLLTEIDSRLKRYLHHDLRADIGQTIALGIISGEYTLDTVPFKEIINAAYFPRFHEEPIDDWIDQFDSLTEELSLYEVTIRNLRSIEREQHHKDSSRTI